MMKKCYVIRDSSGRFFNRANGKTDGAFEITKHAYWSLQKAKDHIACYQGAPNLGVLVLQEVAISVMFLPYKGSGY